MRLGINYGKTVEQRDADGEVAVGIVKEALKDGWNPFDMPIKRFLSEQSPTPAQKLITDLPGMPFSSAIAFAVEKKRGSLKPSSATAYADPIRFALEAAKKLGMSQLPIGQFKKVHIKLLLDQMGKDRQAFYDKQCNGKAFTGNTYNRYKAVLSAHFYELEQWEAIEYNPCDKIPDRDEVETGVHRHATDEELRIIKSELPKVYPALYEALRFEHGTGMRPNEILNITLDMVDELNSLIRLTYFEGKTKVFREVPVPSFLMEWIIQRREGQPDNHYLFSKGFKPGPKRMGRNYINQNWKRHVKDRLGINVSYYSFKGLGGDAKIDAGIPLRAVSIGWGHTSVKTSQIYLRKEGERLRKQIIANSPEL